MITNPNPLLLHERKIKPTRNTLVYIVYLLYIGTYIIVVYFLKRLRHKIGID